MRLRRLVCMFVPLAACTPVVPSGPSFTALPRPGESFQTFQAKDAACRVYAQTQMDASTGATGNSQGLRSAALGTGIGAASGALFGAAGGNAGAGAAIGAGSGLLVGSVLGTANAQRTSAVLQHRYDGAYAQCMVGHGEQLPPPPPMPMPMVYGPPAMIAYPPPTVLYPMPVDP